MSKIDSSEIGGDEELDVADACAAVPSGVDRTTESTRSVDLILAAIVSFAPPLAFCLAMWLWYAGVHAPTWIDLFVMLAINFFSLAGVELGFHRLFAHRSYKAHRSIKIALAALGSMGFQGPPIWWASIHRKHHRYSDQPGDPHSMYLYDKDGKFTWRGALHAHIGWVWTGRSVGQGGFARYARDLYLDRDIFWIHMHYFYFLLAGFLIPGIVASLLYGSWEGFAWGILWGGFIRIFFMNHLTFWCINSVTHGVGRRDYDTSDHSTNFAPLALLTLGQSWHNNHHAFPISAVMSHQPWQLDPGAWILHGLRRIGLVTDMNLPTPEAILKKRQAKNNA